MVNQHPDESAAIARAVRRNGTDVQEQAARDAQQANHAETWSMADAHKIATWQDVLHELDRLAAFAIREIARDKQVERRLAADAARIEAEALQSRRDDEPGGAA